MNVNTSGKYFPNVKIVAFYLITIKHEWNDEPEETKNPWKNQTKYETTILNESNDRIRSQSTTEREWLLDDEIFSLNNYFRPIK